MHWYSADLHALHASIIKLSRRPFANMEEMNARLVENFRARVRPDDDLWILGDFAHWHATEAELRAIFDAIPGRKHLVIGNHDNALIRALPWASEPRDIVRVVDGNTQATLCHYPMITWNGSRKKNAIQLFGHVHQNWAGSRNSVNVGVDQWDFRPVGMKEILARARTLPVNPIWNIAEPGTRLVGQAQDETPDKV